MVKGILIHIIILSTLCTCWQGLTQNQGYASYYSKHLKGRRTSDKSKYHPDSLTCAHLTYPLGAYLKVKNMNNDSIVIVKVTDRGPHSRRRIIDLSYRAAQQLDFIRQGTCKVMVTPLDSSLLSKDSVSMDSTSVSDSINMPIHIEKRHHKMIKIRSKNNKGKHHKITKKLKQKKIRTRRNTRRHR